MKQLFVLSILFFALCRVVYAQKDRGLKLGTRITLGQSELIGDDFSGKRPGIMMGIGGSADYQMNNWLGLMGDAMFIRKSALIKGREQGGIVNGEQTFTDRYHFYQAEFPIMGKVRFGSEKFGFRAFAGPSFAFNLFSLQSRIYDDQDYNEERGYYNRTMPDMNILEKSVVYGLGVEIMSNHGELMFADIRSSHTLAPIGKINNNDIMMRYFCISLGCLF